MTEIEEIVAFIAKYDQPYPGEIRGAATEKVAALEAAAAQPLRTVYRNFLLAMGESMGWLRPLRAKFKIDDLLAYYRSESWRPPTGCFKFGLAVDDPFFDVYLEAGDAPQPRVVTMPRGPTKDFVAMRESFRTCVAGSLPEFLGTAAYRTLRLDALAYSLRIAGNDAKNQLLPQVQSVLELFGFTSLWFSNDWVQVFDARDAAAIATQFPGGVLAIDLAAAENNRLNALAQALKPRFALVHTFPRQSSSPS